MVNREKISELIILYLSLSFFHIIFKNHEKACAYYYWFFHAEFQKKFRNHKKIHEIIFLYLLLGFLTEFRIRKIIRDLSRKISETIFLCLLLGFSTGCLE